MGYSCWGLEPGQSILSLYQSNLGDRSARHLPPGCWVDHQIVNAGLWQQYGSVAGKHHIHAAIINAHIVLLTVKGPRCIFLPFPSSSQRGREGGDHPGTVPSWNAPIPGREVEKSQGGGCRQRRGWKLCRENAQGDTEIWSPTIWSASLPQPWTLSWTHLIFPTMKSDLAEQRAQVNGQEQSNCLSPWYAAANQS